MTITMHTATENLTFRQSMFVLERANAHCCRDEVMRWAVPSPLEIYRTPDGFSKSPKACHNRCLALPRCKYFAHSIRWSNCVFCSACVFKESQFGAKDYNSFRRLAPSGAQDAGWQWCSLPMLGKADEDLSCGKPPA